MKIGFVADVHVGNHRKGGGVMTAGLNTRARVGLDVLDRAVATALDLDCAAFVVLGDLVHYSGIEPQVLAGLQQVLDVLGMKKVVLKGNHDAVSDEVGDHALGPLKPVAEVVDDSRVVSIGDVDLLCVGFQTGAASDWLPGEIERLATESSGDVRVLCIHLGVSDSKTIYYLDGAEDSINVEVLADECLRNNVRWVLAGNWHNPQVWHRHKTVDGHLREVNVIQCGTLCPSRSLDNHVGAGAMVVLDLEAGRAVPVNIPGPRFVRGSGSDEVVRGVLALARHPPLAQLLSIDMILEDENRDAAVTKVRDALSSIGVHPDHVKIACRGNQTKALQAVERAAAAARDAHDEDVVVRDYLANMPMPAGVEREDVAALVVSLLQGSR